MVGLTLTYIENPRIAINTCYQAVAIHLIAMKTFLSPWLFALLESVLIQRNEIPNFLNSKKCWLLVTIRRIWSILQLKRPWRFLGVKQLKKLLEILKVFSIRYDPRLPSISKIVKKHHRTMVEDDPRLKKHFQQPPMVAYKRNRNLKDMQFKT